MLIRAYPAPELGGDGDGPLRMKNTVRHRPLSAGGGRTTAVNNRQPGDVFHVPGKQRRTGFVVPIGQGGQSGLIRLYGGFLC